MLKRSYADSGKTACWRSKRRECQAPNPPNRILREVKLMRLGRGIEEITNELTAGQSGL